MENTEMNNYFGLLQQMKKITAGICSLLLVLLLAVGCASTGKVTQEQTMVTRQLPEKVKIGEPLEITLEVSVSEDGNNPPAGIIIVEKLPLTQKPVLSKPGFSRYDTDSGELRYLLAEIAIPLKNQEITYSLPTSQASPGEYLLEGGVKLPGKTATVRGDRNVTLVGEQ